MNLKNLMMIKAAVCLVLGVPILLVPDFFYGLFGTTLAVGGAFAAREYGASLMGNLLLTWFARNAVESDARRAITLALCVYDGARALRLPPRTRTVIRTPLLADPGETGPRGLGTRRRASLISTHPP